MTNYNRLKDVHEVIDWLKTSKYYNKLSYDFSTEECLLDNQSINLKLFRLKIQEKHNTVFLNGENFKYALITICQTKTNNLNELDSFTVLVKEILQSNKYKDKEYIQIKDILVQLNIHPTNFKREEKKVAKVLKQLNYKKVNRDNTKVWILDIIPVMPVIPENTSTSTELEALPAKEEYQLCQLLDKLQVNEERVKTAEDKYIEINKELQESKKLNKMLENKIKDLEARLAETAVIKEPLTIDRFSSPNRFAYTPLDDL